MDSEIHDDQRKSRDDDFRSTTVQSGRSLTTEDDGDAFRFDRLDSSKRKMLFFGRVLSILHNNNGLMSKERHTKIHTSQ